MKLRHNSFLKFCGIFFIFSVQCTWTPEVTTPIHDSEAGIVALQTSSQFTIPPQHPRILSKPLIKQLLQGISQQHEQGILQELFISDPKPTPVFLPSQIEFLASHFVEAFSKATSEELITFRSLGNEEGGTPLSGTVATFTPTIFFLTLRNALNYPGNTSKMRTSSRNLQKHTTLMFSQKQAMVQHKDAQRMMKVSPKDLWIAIDYATLNPIVTNGNKEKVRQTPAPLTTPPSEENQPRLNTLQQELQDIRKKVEEQEKEIQRLQQAAP